MSEWQSIETAPDTDFVLCYKVVTGPYISSKAIEFRMFGWGGVHGVWFVAPTHWQRLPEPPK